MKFLLMFKKAENIKVRTFKSLFYLCVISSLFLISCGGDDDQIIMDDTPPEPTLNDKAIISAFNFKTTQNTILYKDITAELNEATKEITATIRVVVDPSLIDQKINLVPDLVFSEKATLSPENNKEIELGGVTASPVIYKITSEDGKTENTYTLKTEVKYINKLAAEVVQIDELVALYEMQKSNPNSTGIQGWKLNDTDKTIIENSLSSLLVINSDLSVEEISMNSQNVDALPSEIGNLLNLKKLEITRNNLSVLPEELGDLINIENLDVSFNKLTALPNSIGSLSKLIELDAEDNELSDLPTSISQLSVLETLQLKDNKFEVIPEGVFELTNLTLLGFWDNDLKSIPAKINQLTKLKELDLEFNDLKEIPKEVGELTELTYLYLNNNNLENGGLPEELGNLSKLKLVDIRNNPKLTLLSSTLCAFLNSVINFTADFTC